MMTLNLEYARAGDHALLLDLYTPAIGRGPFPVIVYLHGGGWRHGGKDNPPVLFLTMMGYAVASVSYRLSQVATYPAQIEDAKAAIRWLRANAGEYRLDTGRIGVAGVSAGGHLAALLGTTACFPDFDAHGNRQYSSRVSAVVDFCGPTDLRLCQNSSMDAAESQLLGGPPHTLPELTRLASPVTFVSPDAAPFFIVHGEEDDIVPLDQSERLHCALLKAGVPSTLVAIPGADHHFCPDQVRGVMPQVLDFLHRTVKCGPPVQ